MVLKTLEEQSVEITEDKLRAIIQEEVVLRYLMQEGLWDDVKGGAAKLKALATKQFGKAAAKWGQSTAAALNKLTDLPDQVKLGMEALKVGMSKSGESIKMDDNLRAAKELGSYTSEKALAVAQQDLEGPVHDKAAQAANVGQKAEARYYGAVYSVLVEHRINENDEQLNEFGLTAAAGVGLAVLGGLPMILSGLKKLAEALGAHNVAELLEKAHHVTHLLETKVIDYGVPDKLSWVAYQFLHGKGLRFSKESKDMLTYDEFVQDADKSGAMKQVKGLLYKTLLIYFAFNGLVGVLHAGASMLGFVEGAATTVKGIELARGGMEIAALASKTSV